MFLYNTANTIRGILNIFTTYSTFNDFVERIMNNSVFILFTKWESITEGIRNFETFIHQNASFGVTFTLETQKFIMFNQFSRGWIHY